MKLYIDRFIYRLTVFFKVVLFNLFGITIKTGLKTFQKCHKYQLLYYKKISGNRYKVIYECKLCHYHKVIFLSTEKFLELKNNNLKF